jgi:hypothetical protein
MYPYERNACIISQKNIHHVRKEFAFDLRNNLDKLFVAQLVKFPAFMEPEGLYPRSQEPSVLACSLSEKGEEALLLLVLLERTDEYHEKHFFSYRC